MEKIIKVVRNYPIIYDLSHEDYKNIRKKDKIWSKIGEEIGENGKKLLFIIVFIKGLFSYTNKNITIL